MSAGIFLLFNEVLLPVNQIKYVRTQHPFPPNQDGKETGLFVHFISGGFVELPDVTMTQFRTKLMTAIDFNMP